MSAHDLPLTLRGAAATVTGPYTSSDILRVAEQFRNLYASGFRDVQCAGLTRLTDESILSEVNRCARFIAQMCAPTKTMQRKRSSYEWKHVAERALGQYVCNGAFIASAILAGYRIAQVAQGNPNAFFNMQVSSAPLRAYIADGQRGHFPHDWEW